MALRIPVSTYRLQFNASFRFRDALALVPYLRALGITDVYASPLLQAKRGSSHGYDVTDPSHLNTELGSDEDFDALVAELKKFDMGLILDIVPNHMSASSENPWWMDLLENGASSPFAFHFDVDWHPPSRALDNRVLLPILGKTFAEVLESGELLLSFENGAFFIGYFDLKLPVSPRTYAQILERQLEKLQGKPGIANLAEFQDFLGVVSGFHNLASAPQDSPLDRRQLQELKDRLSRLYATSQAIKRFIDHNIRAFKGRKGIAASFSLLDRLLSQQAYVLAFWQTANQAINYRRFFTISDLVGLRIGDPLTFEASHAVPLRLADKGMVTGFRIDHIDGLRNPQAYLAKLEERLGASNSNGKDLSFYVVVEKILSGTEHLPQHWAVHGTTGYDFLNALNCLFVDSNGLEAIGDIYREYVHAETSYEDLVYIKKKQVMASMLLVEMRSLGHYLGFLALQDRYAREIPRDDLMRALVETTACLPVYRTYVQGFDVASCERTYIKWAVDEAQDRNPHLNHAAIDWLRQLLLLEPAPHLLPEHAEQRLSFVMSWQQLTGPITAKGVEDSALYVYNRLISLNEVGGSPATGCKSARLFHEFIQRRQKEWPITMNATMTHDAKHSEDFRARLNVLSEIPGEWAACVKRWSSWNAGKRTQLKNHAFPDPNEEILIYQTLLGSWPSCECPQSEYLSRIQEFLIKAGREAMVHSRWTVPNLKHEKALTDFVASILEPSPDNTFLADFQPFAQKLAFHGALNALAQLMVKIASPGVADFYQGSELWDLRLVDPDNRCPVDFALRRQKLDAAEKGDCSLQGMVTNWQDGSIKLVATSRALRHRRERAELFLKGRYLPLEVNGQHADSIFSFARRYRNAWAVVIVPRQTTKLKLCPQLTGAPKIWGDTAVALPARAPVRWRHVLLGEDLEDSSCSDGVISVGGVMAKFPVALLEERRT
jgi:(1->4)-alpha-D-glucan 1-alpha-D-glucosylmutase